MANYSIVVDTSNFKPFDINPYLTVLRDLKDVKEKTYDKLEKIEEQAGQYILPETSSYKETQNKFYEDLMKASDAFGRNENDSIRNLRSMFRRYRREILPLNRMVEAYNKYNDTLTTLGPDAIVGNTHTLDDFYGGNNPQIEYRSAKDIQRTAAGVMQGLDNALMSAPEKASRIAEQYFVFRQQGLNGQQALSTIIQHNPMDQQTAEGTSQLIQALDNVYNTYSNTNFSKEANSRIWENTVMGAIQGIQAPKYTMQHDMSYLNPAQQYNLRQSRREDKFKYKYDDKGNIIGYSDEYLKGATTGYGKTPTQTERVPSGGTFHPTVSNAKQENITSSSEVSRDQVPTYIKSQYPDDATFLVCRDRNNVIIGYMGIKYTDRKVQNPDGSASDENVDDSDGEE